MPRTEAEIEWAWLRAAWPMLTLAERDKLIKASRAGKRRRSR
jgi:hypothetical protein